MKSKGNNLKSQKTDKFEEKLMRLLSYLPIWALTYFNSPLLNTVRTKIAYSEDLLFFFRYIIKETNMFERKSIIDITLQDFSMISTADIQEYIRYCTYYINDKGDVIRNSDKGIKRKICVLKSLYMFYYKEKYISYNPALLIEIPKIDNSSSRSLNENGLVDVINVVNEKRYYIRNSAIIKLLAGTGIRISECVTLNLENVLLSNSSIQIQRRGAENILYMDDDTKNALSLYMNERFKKSKLVNTTALFLSSRNKRISVRNIEVLVKNCGTALNTKITPHSFRETYKNDLYKKTGDMNLVADTLGYSYRSLLLNRINN